MLYAVVRMILTLREFAWLPLVVIDALGHIIVLCIDK